MVVHILKDGTQVDDIVGRVIKISEAEAVYRLMDSINRNGGLQREKSINRN